MLGAAGPMPRGYWGDEAKTAETFRTIDGVPAGEALAAEMARISGATEPWRRRRALESLTRRGGREAALEIEPSTGEPFAITLARSRKRLD